MGLTTPCARLLPRGARAVPGPFDTACVEALAALEEKGSVAAPGFMKPEGIVIFHTAANLYFKKTLEKDEMPKQVAERQAAAASTYCQWT
jgi:hypothetical protein